MFAHDQGLLVIFSSYPRIEVSYQQYLICTRDATEQTCQMVVEGLLVFIWVCHCWSDTLIIVAKLSLLRGNLIVMILSLTGHGISVSFVTIWEPAVLCSVYGARDSKKNRNKCWWKMAMPFNYTSKEKAYTVAPRYNATHCNATGCNATRYNANRL